MSASSADSSTRPEATVSASPPTVRRLAAWSLSVFAVLALVSLVALIGSSAVLSGAMDAVSRDTRSAMLASEIESAVLMHQRLSNLHVMTGEEGIERERRHAEMRMQQMLEEAAALVGFEEEQRAVNAVASALAVYLRQRSAAEAESNQLVEVVQAARPALNQVLTDVRALRELNDAHVEQARAQSLQVSRLATWLGASTAVLLVTGFAVIAWGTRRYLVGPVIALHRVMGAFRGGALDARSGGGGVREVHELARMFDDMADSLAEQRQAQLTFIAGVAHDLKSPLATLKTGLYVLAHEPSGEQRAATRTTLDSQVDLLTRMTDDLLDAARIEAGQLELLPSRFDLGRLVQDVVNLCVPTAPDHDLTVAVPDDPVLIEADPHRLEQVIRNLLTNAIKFSPQGGPVEVSVEEQPHHVVLKVSDRGVGIAPGDQADIFLPFRRRRLAAAPGAGLGLSVVRRIVTAHGGDIEVQSRLGEGATFCVRIPQRRT